MDTDSDSIKTWLSTVENGKIKDYDKTKFSLQKYWIDCREGFIPFYQEFIIKLTFEKLPSFWRNILEYIVSSVQYDDPIKYFGSLYSPTATYESIVKVWRRCYIKKVLEDVQNLSNNIEGKVPYYILCPHMLPFRIISKAFKIEKSYFYRLEYLNIPGYELKKKTFLALCGVQQPIDENEIALKSRFEFEDGVDYVYGISLMRSYFCAKIIQRQWRAYVIKRNHAAKTIQRVWKRQIASPFTVIGKNRLHREFNEMIEVYN